LTRVTLALLSGLGILFVVGTSDYLTREKLHYSDYYHLLLILILGAAVLVSSRDLVAAFIALEVMSLPAYTLAGFRRNDSRSNEAAIKYFILGGAIGAVFLLGSSFLFGATGSTNLSVIQEWSRSSGGPDALFRVGQVLVIASFLFKVAAAPFHFWKPDVYEGAPVPVTGIMATIVTSGAFLFLVRLAHLPEWSDPAWSQNLAEVKLIFRIAAGASLVIGSAVMITQKNLKRMMAYSSITHSGYLLLGLLGTLEHPEQIHSVLIYLLGYSLMSTGVFVLMSLSQAPGDSGVELVDMTGLMKRSPALTFLWAVFLFSMAGMPFTIGFFAKYFVFLSSISGGEVVLVVVAALCTVVSAYAYLRPVALMVMREADPGAAVWSARYKSQIVVIIAAAGVLFLGTMPNAMIQYLKWIPLIR
jgi:NADH-quinone oxidoreductase subunit N